MRAHHSNTCLVSRGLPRFTGFHHSTIPLLHFPVSFVNFVAFCEKNPAVCPSVNSLASCLQPFFRATLLRSGSFPSGIIPLFHHSIIPVFPPPSQGLSSLLKPSKRCFLIS